MSAPIGVAAYSYNENGQIASLTNPLNEEDTTYGYDSKGRPSSRLDPGGISWSRSYDPVSGLLERQTITQNGTELADVVLAHDRAGNIVSEDLELLGSQDNGVSSYAYDRDGRLATFTDPQGLLTKYGYDGAGNRISLKEGDDPVVTTTYDASGLPVSSSDGTTFGFDDAGNLTEVAKQGTTIYSYDPWGRTVEAATPQGTFTYSYDALDRTTERTGATTTTFSFTGLGDDPARITEGGVTTDIAYGPNGPLAQKTGLLTSYLLTDLHHDVIATADVAGLSSTRTYSPWGEDRKTTGEPSPLGFQRIPSMKPPVSTT